MSRINGLLWENIIKTLAKIQDFFAVVLSSVWLMHSHLNYARVHLEAAQYHLSKPDERAVVWCTPSFIGIFPSPQTNSGGTCFRVSAPNKTIKYRGTRKVRLGSQGAFQSFIWAGSHLHVYITQYLAWGVTTEALFVYHRVDNYKYLTECCFGSIVIENLGHLSSDLLTRLWPHLSHAMSSSPLSMFPPWVGFWLPLFPEKHHRIAQLKPLFLISIYCGNCIKLQ